MRCRRPARYLARLVKRYAERMFFGDVGANRHAVPQLEAVQRAAAAVETAPFKWITGLTACLGAAAISAVDAGMNPHGDYLRPVVFRHMVSVWRS